MSQATKLSAAILLVYLALLALLWHYGTALVWMVLSFLAFILAMAVALLSGGPSRDDALPDYVSAGLRPDGAVNAGVNADLDPVEAATLLRIAPGRILTMILYGLVRKGNVRITSIDPVQMEVVSHKDMNYYEGQFSKAIGGDALDPDALLACFGALALQVSDKMRLYSIGQTKDYFAGMIEDAWKDVEAVDTPELAVRQVNDHALWLIVDEAYIRKMNNEIPVEENGVRPLAWWYYGPTIATKCRDHPIPMVEWPYSRPVAEYMGSVSSRIVGDKKRPQDEKKRDRDR